MNPYMAYDAVNTKIVTKKRLIFDESKLEKILDCTTVDQVKEFLKSRYNLKEIIDDAKSHDLHRDDLETLLYRYEVFEIERILHYFSGPYREFLQTFLMKYEIFDLVLILRKIAKDEENNGLEKHFAHSDNYSDLPYGKLTASKTVAQFIENLRGTGYYSSLKTVTDSDVVKRGFHIEMKLQVLFYKTLVNRAEKLMAPDRKAALELIGMKIDFLNVQWIYRAKKYYDISPEQVLIYSLQNGRKLGFSRLRKICYSKTAEDMQLLCNKYLKYKVFTSGSELEIERNIDNYIYRYVKDREYKGTIGIALLYIFMFDIIVKDLVTVTEGIRYKLPRENLKEYLVHS